MFVFPVRSKGFSLFSYAHCALLCPCFAERYVRYDVFVLDVAIAASRQLVVWVVFDVELGSNIRVAFRGKVSVQMHLTGFMSLLVLCVDLGHREDSNEM